MIYNNITSKFFYILIVVLILSYSCKRDEYYTDGGLAVAEFDGSMLQYLESKPNEFDTIAHIIRLAGLENMFSNEEITFFAPQDRDIKDMIGTYTRGGLNKTMYDLGLDTIVDLSDVPSFIWEKYLLRHVFKGKNKLADYPQIDQDLLNVFGGQYYTSFEGAIFNIGVVFNDAVGGGSVLKYMGYRQLHISIINDLSNPQNMFLLPVSSSDILPHNGVVHILDHTRANFGFNMEEVREEIIISKR